MSVLNNAFLLFFSFSSLGAGLFFASAHPVAPLPVTLMFVSVSLLLFWRPPLGVVSLPVLLPILNFSPWTGWLIVDEFDLFVLSVVAAGYFRMWWDELRLQQASIIMLLAVGALLVAQGVNTQAAQELNWFSGYMSPMNALRVGKSFLWVGLLFPLVAQASKGCSLDKSAAVFFRACLMGSCGVVLAVLWERSFFPGLLDFSTPYRTVGLFWEMHQGGAALDAYLVLIAPILVWAWREKMSSLTRLALGAFVLVFVYVCLTTFSRGVYGAIAGSMVFLGVLLSWRRAKEERATRDHSLANIAISLLIALEIGLALGADSFLTKRLGATERDLGGRWQHWSHGIRLLKTRDEWFFGIGLGKLPARLTQGAAGLWLPGSYEFRKDAAQQSLVITGPNSASSSAQGFEGLYGLSQRVDLISGQRYYFAGDIRSEQNAVVLIQMCELHLLYPAACQVWKTRIKTGGWQRLESPLVGNQFREHSWRATGHGVFSISVLTPGTKIEVTDLHLSAEQGNLLRNSRFLDREAGWFPVARSYFLPWHIDNLYLEILIETGLVGLFGFLAAVFLIVWRLFLTYMRGNVLASYFLACVAGLMVLGLVVSIFDMPRVATLFGLFLVWGWNLTAATVEPKCGGDRCYLAPLWCHLNRGLKEPDKSRANGAKQKAGKRDSDFRLRTLRQVCRGQTQCQTGGSKCTK